MCLNKELFDIAEIPKYKKKSKAKGQPRADHKHVYETVLLRSNYSLTDFKTGATITKQLLTPTKVCIICGRVLGIDRSPIYYDNNSDRTISLLYYGNLSESALKLPKWCTNDIFAKFAVPEASDVES